MNDILNYETVIGLEVHVELKTASKMFCRCKNTFGAEENTCCCPGCLGFPGTLPVINGEALKMCIKTGLAFNCEITRLSKFDRKNYFYPDLAKAFQDTQDDLPLCRNGFIEIESETGEKKKIGITRIHMEEDTGKLLHDDYNGCTKIDFNRSGVPLIEIVSEPDMRSPKEAYDYLESLRNVLKFIDISDCKIQEGSIRCDMNLSVRKAGTKKLGVRVETKNIGSFRAVANAAAAEAMRQVEIIEAGGTLVQETRRWDDLKGESYPMRSKENAGDYRYFPEPDLPFFRITDEFLASIEIPELPEAKKARYESLGVPSYDAYLIGKSFGLSRFYDEALNLGANPRQSANWILSDISRLLNERKLEEIPFSPQSLHEMIKLIEDGKINSKIAKQVIELLFDKDRSPIDIVAENNWIQIGGGDELKSIAEQVVAANEKSVADYKGGKDRALGYLVGEAMRLSKGRANPQVMREIFLEILKG